MTTETLPEEMADESSESRTPKRRWAVIGLVAVLVIGIVGAWALWPARGEDVRAGTTVVTNDGMAAKYGIDITMIGVTAAGGMVDFRYQVVDPDKADQVVHDLDLFPKMVNEETGATLVLRSLPHSHNQRLDLGGNYFFLVPNANNAVRPGDSVTLVIGDLRLEHVIAEG
jgi:hypothetical protein